MPGDNVAMQHKIVNASVRNDFYDTAVRKKWSRA
jgi:hypothetical protein